MHHLTEKLKKLGHPPEGKVNDQMDPATVAGANLNVRPISRKDVYRCKKQYGVNLGSWFTLERWICEDPFRQAVHPAQSDYDVAQGVGAKELLERHWDSWITEEDWKWMSTHGINTVRIPIGFYHLCGLDPSVLHGTDFSRFYDVYNNAWSRLCDAFITADRFGIGVILDLHAAPGKQNADAHSGQTGPVRFFEPGNLDRTRRILCLLAKELSKFDNTVGLQLLNEPQNHHSLENWYRWTIDAIRQIPSDLPIYIHDAWDTREFAHFVNTRSDFVVLDTHIYRCFTSSDHKLSGDEHAVVFANKSSEFVKSFVESSQLCKGNIIIGEFSAALNPQSLRSDEPREQDRQRRVFARAELDLFKEICSGWVFWTYKKVNWDAGWSMRDAMLAAILPEQFGMKKFSNNPVQVGDEVFQEVKERAIDQHTSYWSKYKGHYEHWRFEEGFLQGWNDTFEFANFPMQRSGTMSELGFLGQWTKKRLAEHVTRRGSCKNLWEFEHGLSQGVNNAMVEIRKLSST